MLLISNQMINLSNYYKLSVIAIAKDLNTKQIMEVYVNTTAESSSNIELNNLKSQIPKSSRRYKKNMHRIAHKLITVSCCSIGIIISWLVALASTLALTVQAAINPNDSSLIISQTNTLLNELPPINLSNISNYSIYSIQCENRFVYEPTESVCYPPCDWDPSETGITLIIEIFYFIISAISLILCVCTLISWIVASVKCRSGKRGCDFQLARASLFMVVLSKLAMYIIFTCIDIIGRNGLVCRTNEFGESYLIAHQLFSVSSNPNTRLLVNILGQLYTFWLLFSSLWTIFGFTNIILLVFLTSRIRDTLKRQILTFCIEMGIAMISPMIILSIVTGVDSSSTFAVNYIVLGIYIRNIIAFLLIITLSYSLTSGYVLTAVILILTKLRFVSLRSEKITGQGTQLTELEKRMFIYAVALGILYSVIGLNSFIFSRIEGQFITGVLNYTLCVNVNSPITLIPLEYAGLEYIGPNISYVNSTLSVYRNNIIGNLTECERILSDLNVTVPIWSLIIFGIVARIEGMVVFIVLIPRCSISCCRKLIFSKLTSFYTRSSM